MSNKPSDDFLNPALYVTCAGKKIFASDISDSLKLCGINDGDTVFVHSDISVFGKIGQVRDRGVFLGFILDLLKNAVGQMGTIIMPAFSYSFTKNEAYDPQNTPSSVGVLTEYFRKQPGVVRSLDPIFSVAAWGRQKEFFTSDIGNNCFSRQSVFGKLNQKNAKIIFFGAPFNSCTFIHHIEQMANVPYRYFKTFSGRIDLENKTYDTDCEYFVRPLDKNVELDLARFKDRLVSTGFMKEINLGAGKILAIGSNAMFGQGQRSLKEDIYFFLKNQPLK